MDRSTYQPVFESIELLYEKGLYRLNHAQSRLLIQLVPQVLDAAIALSGDYMELMKEVSIGDNV